MFDFEWPENLSIFLDNLCIYHVCFDLVSFFMIVFTWWFCRTRGRTDPTPTAVQSQEERDMVDEVIEEVMKDSEHSEDSGEKTVNWSDKDKILSNLKIMRQRALVKELKSKLTEDELEEEKKTEKMQLEKIFQLLQDQEEKFQMSSMEQLQDQLHLYRP